MLLPFGDDGEGTPRNKGGICELPDTRALQGRRTIFPAHRQRCASCDASRMVLAKVPKRTRNAASPLFVTQA